MEKRMGSTCPKVSFREHGESESDSLRAELDTAAILTIGYLVV